MKIPVTTQTAEIEVKRSRFIAIAEKIEDTDMIKDIITRTRAAHPQANHVVHAAVVGTQGTQYSMSDDHEPKNTAGRPVLEILKGSGITNILVMVIRYFGGTLLGTGGLVKAYGDAAKAVLDTLETEELIEKSTITIKIGYDLYEQVRNMLAEYHGENQEDFATEVTIVCTLPSIHAASAIQRITDLSAGRAVVDQS
jgi:uncharacterized YigZ family protein